MVVGLNAKPGDLNLNPCKKKALTNTRTTSKDESPDLAPITPMTLERALEFI
jgi:GTP-binding protein